MQKRRMWHELLYVDLLWLAFFAGGLRLPFATSLLAVVFYDLAFLLWLTSPNVVRAAPRPRELLARPELLTTTSFLALLGGNLAYLSLVFYLTISGIPLAFKEIISRDFSYAGVVFHFLVGLAVVALAISYAVARVYRLGVEMGSFGRALGYAATDFVAGLAILLLFLFSTQFLPVIIMYILTMGLGCVAALAIAVYVTRRSRRFPDARTWLRAWANASFVAPFGVLVVLLFGYGPFRTHFSNADILQWHSSFALFATVAIALVQVHRIAAAAWVAPSGGRVRTLRSGLGRLLAAIGIALGLHGALRLVAATPLDLKAIHDFLLPLN